ncbi:MAG TPA: permease-like cell division protein FtsX [Gaiellaceae bacterium]|jgi:cell division transport system permease protein
MSRIRLLVSEAWNSLAANFSTTFAATLTVLVGMFLLGLVIGFGSWTRSLSDHYKRQLLVKVYFEDSASGQQVDAVRQRLDGDPRIKQIEFVSKADALKQMQKTYPQLFKTSLPSNPFPRSYVVTPTKGEYTEQLGRELIAAHLAGVEPGSDGVKWGGKTAHSVLTVARVIWAIFLIGFVLLLVASTLLIANTIRLSLFARRREIEVMKLVGATNWFVRGPFMLEGVFCGLLGALLAIVLLLIGKEIALPAVIGHFHAGSDVHAWPFAVDALALLAAGLLLGAAGSGLTLRRFLQV